MSFPIRGIIGRAGRVPAGLARRWRGPGTRILTYHRVSAAPDDRLCVTPRQFARQMESLAGGDWGEVVPLSRLLREGKEEGKAEIAVTFDDGYADLYRHAFGILRSLGLPATVFVVTEFVEGRGFLKRFGPGAEFLNWEMIGEMEESGIEAGSHTVTHRELVGLPPAEVEWELAESLRALERRLGRRRRWLAYPRGRFDAAVKTAARRSGYAGAVTVLPGANRSGRDLFALRRTEISRADGPEEFKLKLSGAFDWWHSARQKLTKEG